MKIPNKAEDVVRVDRRSFLRGVGASLALGTLAACGSAPTTSAPAPAATAAPATNIATAVPAPAATVAPAAATVAPVAATGGSTTFTAWSLNEGASKEVITGLITAYGEKNGTSITPVAYPYNEYLNQLVLQARGKNATGAAQLDIAWLPALAAMGVLQDLGPTAQGASYTETALLSGQSGGKQLGLPWTTGSVGMIANQALLDQAGVTSMPTTIAEFEAALEKLKQLGNGVVPYAAMTDVAQMKDVIPWIWTFGGTVMQDNKLTLGDEGSVKALDWYKSLMDRGYIAPDVDRFDARALFSQGKVGFYDDAIVARAALIKDSPVPDLASKIVPMARPVLNAGDTPQALLWGHLIVVFNNGDTTAATDLAKYLTSDLDTTVAYFDALSLPPTTTAALASGSVKNNAYVSGWSELITATALPNPFWAYAQTSQMEKLLGEQVQAVMTGQTSAADALVKANEGISKLIG